MNFPDPDGLVWLDGVATPTREARIDTGDPALLGGVGLFETLAHRGGAILDLEEHLDRLALGAARMGILGPPRERLVETLLAAAGEPSVGNGWIKLVLTGNGRTIVFSGESDPPRAGRPCSAVILQWRRLSHGPLAGLKTLSYADNVQALDAARARGADEGLWLTRRGHLAEGCASNLFVVRQARLFTPSISEGILPGIVRAKTIQAARRLGIQVHQGKLRIRRLREASEAFLTSSLRGVAPLVLVDGRPVANGEPGSQTGHLSREVAKLRTASPGGGRVRMLDPPQDGRTG